MFECLKRRSVKRKKGSVENMEKKKSHVKKHSILFCQTYFSTVVPWKESVYSRTWLLYHPFLLYELTEYKHLQDCVKMLSPHMFTYWEKESECLEQLYFFRMISSFWRGGLYCKIGFVCLRVFLKTLRLAFPKGVVFLLKHQHSLQLAWMLSLHPFHAFWLFVIYEKVVSPLCSGFEALQRAYDKWKKLNRKEKKNQFQKIAAHFAVPEDQCDLTGEVVTVDSCLIRISTPELNLKDPYVVIESLQILYPRAFAATIL